MSIRHIVVDTGLGRSPSPLRTGPSSGCISGTISAAQVTFGPEVAISADPLLGEAARQLHDYLAGERVDFDLPLAAEGNGFQRAVWGIVAGVPRGKTTTYGRIAEQLGDRRMAYRVGQAVGANPLRILVPCHRVVGASGALTGYAGGLKRKQALLELEEPTPVSAGRLF